MLLNLLSPILILLAFQMAASFVVAFFLKEEYLKSFRKWSYVGFVVVPLSFPLVTIIKLYWPLIQSGMFDMAAVKVNIELIYFLLILAVVMCVAQFVFNTFALERVVYRKK
jgi:hypothetical protein